MPTRRRIERWPAAAEHASRAEPTSRGFGSSHSRRRLWRPRRLDDCGRLWRFVGESPKQCRIGCRRWSFVCEVTYGMPHQLAQLVFCMCVTDGMPCRMLQTAFYG